jgi:cytochrome c oxidase subunit 2
LTVADASAPLAVLPRGATEGFGALWPMNYLQTFGPRADPATTLTWGLLWLSLAVIAITALLVVIGVLRAPRRPAGVGADLPAARAGPSAMAWIYVGLAFTGVALVATLLWTVEVLAAVTSPPGRPALAIEVIGHQWWWEVRYLGDRPDQSFVTANEIHIPTGRPVLVRLQGADVIHSFWVPALTGKTDTIPGRTNLTWLQANRPGVYRGQCTEYCGLQHAHMAVYVVAEAPRAFDAWRAGQVEPAAMDPRASDGANVFQARCGVCHSVRGTAAGGLLGPDLTHLMSRRTLAAGVLPNDPGSLAGWIGDPDAIKPGARMPATNLTGAQLLAVTNYLETLR